ncbi:hydroxyacylglutathione hydrolase [Komagataeibacter intermedius]|uniref:Hydroxyacylglutathione hydrolase n=2 Tax=Komagataeibacter intermedius TaxID=66229 RepID=A0A0N0MHE4_9PROT|nr:hydroxyacylglutathione hydrolase [Komagataeibacter intermedius]KPH89004.1 hydroxyacylglutathione hydrolase [Komagataeibacter intermedius AF2]MCF3635071.1 hydroxyacylglutathione hydrolase [Komagataeibacter intermedius]GAN87592.1 hydroxyacylglutathione hydrolase [Komagataeibacter intermedius TF2]GBQ66160.1 hydroxyacylglutathione hydrolase [Komagataeibacter intermedius NRIC 0521]
MTQKLAIKPIPILSDNYAWFVHDVATGAAAMVDPAQEAPLTHAIDAAGGRLDLIFLTHHHADHIAAADALRQRYGAKIVGPDAEAARLPRLDVAVRDGDVVALGHTRAEVIATPGHTAGEVSYYFPDGPALFCGDTLFSMGCGRLFEGTPAEMFASLSRIRALPDDTLICCGHEYTQSNARFALHVDPDNAALKARAAQVADLRRRGLPTLPVPLSVERQTNPFLRASDAATLGLLRKEKDSF